MEKTILIAGKDFPYGRDFASGALLKRNSVIITCDKENNDLPSGDGSVNIVWNKASSLSSRSLVLSSMNVKGRLDEVVLYFDEELFAPKFGNPGSKESLQCFDELILSYQYLTSEILLRFNQRKNAGLQNKIQKIVFIYKSNPSVYESVFSQELKNSAKTLSKALVASAASAFKAFAQNIAASLIDSAEIIPLLVECAPDNEFYNNDSDFSRWLCDYMDELDELKKSLTEKQKLSWIKAGSKLPGKFSLFK